MSPEQFLYRLKLTDAEYNWFNFFRGYTDTEEQAYTIAVRHGDELDHFAHVYIDLEDHHVSCVDNNGNFTFECDLEELYT